MDYEAQTEHMVTVTAMDPSLASTMVYVMIMVNDKDDKAVIAKLDPGDYPENATGPVASFTATDADGETISWSLKEDTATDYMKFDISTDGVLTFKSPPDFEAKADIGGTFQGDNVYSVMVVANEGELTVEVTVTDVEEEGEVRINRPQPQVGVSVGTDHDDGDGEISSATWQWARSSDMATWTDITNATSMSYSPAEADVGSHLRATVSYTDRRGPGKTASAITENPVEAKTLTNTAPAFPKEDDSNLDDADLDGQ